MAGVRVSYFDDSRGSGEAFMRDLQDSAELAQARHDLSAANHLIRLGLVYVVGNLGAKTVDGLDAYPAQRRPWQQTAHWSVYLPSAPPTIAYAVNMHSSGTVNLVAVAACYRFPNHSADRWWRAIVWPRLRKMLTDGERGYERQ